MMITTAPLQTIKYQPTQGIPNWTTDAVLPAGSASAANGSAAGHPFVLAKTPIGAPGGYASLAAARTAVTLLADTLGGQATAIVHEGGVYVPHPLWSYKHAAGAANTRLAGLTVSTFQPLTQLTGFVTTPYLGIAAVISGANTIEVRAE